MKVAKTRMLFDSYYDDVLFNEAKKICIDRHFEDCPEDTKWVPTDEQIWSEYNFQKQNEWLTFTDEFGEFIEDYDFSFILQGSIDRWDGRYAGGFVFETFDELSRAWGNCDYVKLYDENGRLYIECSHHDGTNRYEIRMLNAKGYEYYHNNYGYCNDRELHNRLMKAPYSVLPNYAHKVLGCKLREYEEAD